MAVRKFSAGGGLELYALKLVEGLLDRGVAVTVLCQDDEVSLAHKGLTIVKYDSAPKSLSKWQRMKHDFDAVNKAAEQLRSKVDLTHSQHQPMSAADAVTFHNHTASRLSQVGFPWQRAVNDMKLSLVPAYKARHEFDAMLCHNASCLIFPAEVMREDFYATFPWLDGKPYVVAHPGSALHGDTAMPGSAGGDPSVANTSLPGSAGVPPAVHKFTFLFVGRGFRKKGLDVLLHACQILQAQGKDFRLHIAGLKERLADKFRLSAMGLNGRVVYLGFQQDMAQVYSQAQAMVSPSRLEPFGMAVVQAMQHGLVPIVSQVSGVAEVLNDGSDSLILKDHLSATELATLMGTLMDQQSQLAEMREKAKRTAATVTWESTVESTLKAYEIVMSHKVKQP
jgi:glycosyltransferase involved in cell wall biosynthesis